MVDRDDGYDTEIGVTADDGVVTLSGTVESGVHRLAAQEAARRVAGVREVTNAIVVRGGSPCASRRS
jgi:osmotically-inducible protein OsmY